MLGWFDAADDGRDTFVILAAPPDALLKSFELSMFEMLGILATEAQGDLRTRWKTSPGNSRPFVSPVLLFAKRMLESAVLNSIQTKPGKLDGNPGTLGRDRNLFPCMDRDRHRPARPG
jgi:hypothetical protein